MRRKPRAFFFPGFPSLFSVNTRRKKPKYLSRLLSSVFSPRIAAVLLHSQHCNAVQIPIFPGLSRWKGRIPMYSSASDLHCSQNWLFSGFYVWAEKRILQRREAYITEKNIYIKALLLPLSSVHVLHSACCNFSAKSNWGNWWWGFLTFMGRIHCSRKVANLQ